MKLPRWLVIGMLASSVLAVLAAVGWWWVTWPERTAREFVELLAAKELDEARRMLVAPPPENPRPGLIILVAAAANWNPQKVQPKRRSLLDIFAARQSFYATEGWFYWVERGKICSGPNYAGFPPGTIWLEGDIDSEPSILIDASKGAFPDDRDYSHHKLER